MRLPTALLLCFFTISLSAAPIIAPELKREVPAEEIKTLITISEELFDKKVQFIEYIYRDEPPVGDSAAIVRFMPEKVSETIFVFPAAFFYYLLWSKDDPLPAEKKKVIRSQWASDGELQKREKYRCILASGAYFISFEQGIGYEEAMELLRAIESDNYDIDFDTGSTRWDELLKSADPKEFRGLKVSSIYYLTVQDGLEIKTKQRERRITVNVKDPKSGLSTWTFTKKGTRYVLVEMYSHVI